MKAQPKLALLAAAAAQAGTQAPSAQPWSAAQDSSTWPMPSTTACRSGLHSFSIGGGSPVVSPVVSPVPSLVELVVVSVSLALEVSLIEAGWVVSPVSPVVLVPVVGASPVPVMPPVVGSLAWLPLPVGSSVTAPVEGPPVVAAVALASVAPPVVLASLPPPQAATIRPHVVHCIPDPRLRIGPSTLAPTSSGEPRVRGPCRPQICAKTPAPVRIFFRRARYRQARDIRRDVDRRQLAGETEHLAQLGEHDQAAGTISAW
jgi:hypothetical protein